MIKVILRLKDKDKVQDLTKYGAIIYKSPILNIVGLEISQDRLSDVRSDENVLSCDIEPKGELMPV